MEKAKREIRRKAEECTREEEEDVELLPGQ